MGHDLRHDLGIPALPWDQGKAISVLRILEGGAIVGQ